MKVLQVVEQAFRTLAEEQDDTILWLTQSMHSAGADLSVLLTGHCAYYAVQTERQPPLALGHWHQTEPADLIRDLDGMLQKGIPIYVIEEELAERGLTDLLVHPGIKIISRINLVDLYRQVDQIWQW